MTGTARTHFCVECCARRTFNVISHDGTIGCVVCGYISLALTARQILADSHVEGFIAAETALERVRAHGLYAQAVERATWAGYRDIYRRVMADITAAVPS
jgi:succinate dehydrogenase/fumarate reductase flavoprotein subunit